MLEILTVTGLFLLRVGIPVVMLVVLGILIDKWQTRREAELRRQMKPDLKTVQPDVEQDAANKKAA